MALEDKTDTVTGQSYIIELLANTAAANGAPSAAAGISANAVRFKDKIRIAVRSTAGSGAMTVTARLWMRAGGLWFVAKDLNGGAAIAETGVDTIAYSEEVDVLKGADRLYLELVALAGTTPAFTGYAIV